jgi:hypothetical protein
MEASGAWATASHLLDPLSGTPRNDELLFKTQVERSQVHGRSSRDHVGAREEEGCQRFVSREDPMTRHPVSLSPAGEDDPFLSLIAATLRKVVVALRGEEVMFALGGSIASWVRGGPGPTRDVDLMVKPDEAEQTLDALARAGLRTERPAENWLFKAWDGDTPVDVIFRPGGLTIDDEIIARAQVLSVMGCRCR